MHYQKPMEALGMHSLRILFIFCVLSLLGACGQTQMLQTSGKIRAYMIDGNYPAALGTLRQSKNEGFKEQDRVVFWMNEGMLLHLNGKYEESNTVLEKAEMRSKELYTKSISKGIKAAFTSDAATDYVGEDYENVLVNVVKSLNYLALGKFEESMVEARKINEKLALYNTRYARKNVYNQDAFAHWLMGILFEMERSYDDARIAYVKALEVYQKDFAANYGMKVPSYLPEDIIRASLLSQSSEDVKQYRDQFGAGLGTTAEELKSKGEVILVHLNGEGPSKSDFFVNCYFENAAVWFCDAEPGGEFMKKTTITVGKGTAIKVAFPELHVHAPVNPLATISTAGVTAQSELALPISGIAVKTLADKMHRIFKDAIIRVITKTLTTKVAGKVGSAAGGGDKKNKPNMLGWFAEKATSVAMQATEEADKRAWTTLPSQIEIGRMLLPPGKYDLAIQLPHGGSRMIRGVTVAAGKRVFVTNLTLP